MAGTARSVNLVREPKLRTSTGRFFGSSLAAAAVGGGLASSHVVAQEVRSERERGGILLGSFVTDRQSDTRLDSPAQSEGTDLDLEDDLGLESSTSVVRLGGHWWLNRRHRLDFSYFDLSRSATRPVKETIAFGDKIFVVDTAIETNAVLRIVKADYTFAAIEREHGFLGVTGGLYVASGQIELREKTLGSAEALTLTAPLPILGLRGDYAFTGQDCNPRRTAGAFVRSRARVGALQGFLRRRRLHVHRPLGRRACIQRSVDGLEHSR